MKPGPELDALVAEKVMEWKVIRFDNIGLVELVTDEERLLLNEFRPSRDIVDAWEVVKVIETNVGGIQLMTLCDEKKYLFKIWNGKNFIEGNAETAPLAICLAALKSVGVEVDHD